MCAIFHEGCFPSLLSLGNGVILRGFLCWLVHFTCICRIDQELFTLKKPKLNPRKVNCSSILMKFFLYFLRKKNENSLKM